MRKHCEVDESLKAMFEDYKVKIAQPENTTKSLQDQLSLIQTSIWQLEVRTGCVTVDW